MKIFNNPETKKALLISAAATVVFAAAAFFYNRLCAVYVILAGLAVTVAFSVSCEYRYRRIEKMSIGIDKILHGSDELVLSDFCEGELAILKNEVAKMTRCLVQSKEALEKDKVFLTNSIADISHQLRTPLTSVNLLLSALSDKDLEYEKRLRMIYELKRLSARIDWLIEALLKISKIDAGTVTFDRKSVRAQSLISSAAEPLAAALELRGQNIVTSGEEVIFECDPGWTGEAISNILKNCMEHNPDGANIYITSRHTNIFTELMIEDEGGGFEKEDLPHIFERFYKGKNDSSEGFGIGLSLARMIVCGQDGVLFAENRKQGGARFVMRFYFATV